MLDMREANITNPSYGDGPEETPAEGVWVVTAHGRLHSVHRQEIEALREVNSSKADKAEFVEFNTVVEKQTSGPGFVPTTGHCR